MSHIIIAYLGLSAAYIILDLLWLHVIAGGWYRSELGSVLSEHYAVAPGIIFYCIFTAILFYLASYLSYLTSNISTAALHGFLLGLFAYGTYGLVNLAVLNGWTTKVVIVDMTWGVIVTTAVSLIGYTLLRTLSQ